MQSINPFIDILENYIDDIWIEYLQQSNAEHIDEIDNLKARDFKQHLNKSIAKMRKN